jgi:hypothetical protein
MDIPLHSAPHTCRPVRGKEAKAVQKAATGRASTGRRCRAAVVEVRSRRRFCCRVATCRSRGRADCASMPGPLNWPWWPRTALRGQRVGVGCEHGWYGVV